MTYPKITQATLEPIYPRDTRKDYHFGSLENYRGMFEYIRTQFRLVFGWDDVEFFDASEGVYTVHVQGRLRYILRFTTVPLVSLKEEQ